MAGNDLPAAACHHILRNETAPGALPVVKTFRVSGTVEKGGVTMWLQLFSVVLAIAVGCIAAALILEGQPDKKPRKAKVSVFH